MKTSFAALLPALFLSAVAAAQTGPRDAPANTPIDSTKQKGPWQASPGQTPAVPGQTPAVPAQTPAVPAQTPAVPAQTPAVPAQTPAVPAQTPATPPAVSPGPGKPGTSGGGTPVPGGLPAFLEGLFRLAGPPKPPTPEMFNDSYTKIWELVGTRYHLPEKLPDWSKFRKPAVAITDRATFNDAVEKMLSSLNDEWTAYTPPEAIEKAQQAERNNIFSVGLELLSDAYGDFTVHYVGYGSPAYNTKKIRKGDHIIAINGVRIKGRSRHDVEDRLKAKKADTVTVLVEHEGNVEAVPIVSTDTEPGLVTMRVLPPDKTIIYVRLPDFMGDENIDLLVKAVGSGLAQSGGRAFVLVLDLRGNPGGKFELALALSQRLMVAGEICTITNRTNDLEHANKYQVIPELEFANSTRDARETEVIKWMKTCRLYVLVDGSSASCSEVVTGALKDNGRATIVGTEPTFGKGVAYHQFTPPVGGSLTITTGHYVTPGKRRPFSKEHPYDVTYAANPRDLAREGGIWPTMLVKDERSGDAVDPVLIAVVQDVKAHSFDPDHAAVTTPAPTFWTTRVLLCTGGLSGLVPATLLLVYVRRGRQRHRTPARRAA